jgi:hypothetical protein
VIVIILLKLNFTKTTSQDVGTISRKASQLIPDTEQVKKSNQIL